jgi:mRNA interferase MazF
MIRREVRWYTFATPDKRRPVLILTRNSALRFLAGITVAPITSTIRSIPSEVLLSPAQDGMLNVCAVNLDNIQTVQKAQIGTLLTTFSPLRMRCALFCVGRGALIDIPETSLRGRRSIGLARYAPDHVRF